MEVALLNGPFQEHTVRDGGQGCVEPARNRSCAWCYGPGAVDTEAGAGGPWAGAGSRVCGEGLVIGSGFCGRQKEPQVEPASRVWAGLGAGHRVTARSCGGCQAVRGWTGTRTQSKPGGPDPTLWQGVSLGSPNRVTCLRVPFRLPSQGQLCR